MNLNGEFTLDDKEKFLLLKIARETIVEYINTGKTLQYDNKELPTAIIQSAGVFVSLHKKNGELRGCIGRFDSDEPLYRLIQLMAISSATRDFRFNPVTMDEMSDVEIELSVLSPLHMIQSPDEIELGKHGIYMKKENKSGTLLPQVAVQNDWTKEQFLGHCSRDKAGIGWDGWKDAELYVYTAIIFSEK